MIGTTAILRKLQNVLLSHPPTHAAKNFAHTALILTGCLGILKVLATVPFVGQNFGQVPKTIMRNVKQQERYI